MQLLIFSFSFSTELELFARNLVPSDSLNIIPLKKHKVKHFFKIFKTFFDFFYFFSNNPTFFILSPPFFPFNTASPLIRVYYNIIVRARIEKSDGKFHHSFLYYCHNARLSAINSFFVTTKVTPMRPHLIDI